MTVIEAAADRVALNDLDTHLGGSGGLMEDRWASGTGEDKGWMLVSMENEV